MVRPIGVSGFYSSEDLRLIGAAVAAVCRSEKIPWTDSEHRRQVTMAILRAFNTGVRGAIALRVAGVRALRKGERR